MHAFRHWINPSSLFRLECREAYNVGVSLPCFIKKGFWTYLAEWSRKFSFLDLIEKEASHLITMSYVTQETARKQLTLVFLTLEVDTIARF